MIKHAEKRHLDFLLFYFRIMKIKIILLLSLVLITSCARMGQPDGGWYDEQPPKVIGASPADKGVNVKSQKVVIRFDEFVKIDNATENVIVSPPQLETPEIAAKGKSIEVKLLDSLKANTTYTVDFSDAISDNNENNPLGNYTYTFSTGAEIDTMEVAGYVVEANNLEPVKGILVGLYDDLADSAFQKKPMLRVSRTDASGHFVIKGVKNGKYRVYALQDADGDYRFGQKSEKIAFSSEVFTTACYPDTRQDTLWTDTLHIASISRSKYTHFTPDNIVLRAFNEVFTARYLTKNERVNHDHFVLAFSYGDKELPKIKGLNFNEKDAFIINANTQKDSIVYWLRDTALVNQDTLRMEVQYMATDSLGGLELQTDTLEMLSKVSYAKRMKDQKKAFEKWQKQQEKAKKKGEPYDSIMPKEPLRLKFDIPTTLNPDQNILITSPVPLDSIDISKIHLYSKHDSLWYNARFELQAVQLAQNGLPEAIPDAQLPLHEMYQLLGEWQPGIEYSLEVDSAAFVDIYGNCSAKIKNGFKVGNNDDYCSLLLTIKGMEEQSCIVQLLDRSEKVVKEIITDNGTAEFFYLKPETYYLRLIVDNNKNGKWDTGDFEKNIQPEEVYYFSEKLECRAKWDLTETWNPKAKELYKQKPADIKKQKGDKKKTIKRRNMERARELGIEYIPR